MLFFNSILNDAPSSWALYFQDGASPSYLGITHLNDYLMFYLTFIFIGVIYAICKAVIEYNYNSHPIAAKYTTHGSIVEFIWTLIPALILILVALPSFKLLYLLDEVQKPSMTVKAIGRQWFWCALSSLVIALCVRNTILIASGCKRISLSDVERLGECSMLIKDCPFYVIIKYETIRLISLMVSLFRNYEVNTTLDINYYKHIYLIRMEEVQSSILAIIKHSLQHVGQFLLPKRESYAILRNSGFPKGSNSYLAPQGQESVQGGNGGSVVERISTNIVNSFKGIQSNHLSTSLSGKRYYSTKNVSDKSKSEIKQIYDISYKQLCNLDLIKEAYSILKSKPGNMTPGTDNETLDKISLKWAEKTIQELKDRSFQFKPSKRIYIPKKNGKLRPLGIPSPKDKVIQQAIKMILESKFEPMFLNTSHGFRPSRSPLSAIFEVRKWNGIS